MLGINIPQTPGALKFALFKVRLRMSFRSKFQKLVALDGDAFDLGMIRAGLLLELTRSCLLDGQLLKTGENTITQCTHRAQSSAYAIVDRVSHYPSSVHEQCKECIST